MPHGKPVDSILPGVRGIRMCEARQILML